MAAMARLTAMPKGPLVPKNNCPQVPRFEPWREWEGDMEGGEMQVSLHGEALSPLSIRG